MRKLLKALFCRHIYEIHARKEIVDHYEVIRITSRCTICGKQRSVRNREIRLANLLWTQNLKSVMED